MIQQPDPRVVAKVALAITASPYEQQPQIFKQVLDALVETCRKQGLVGSGDLRLRRCLRRPVDRQLVAGDGAALMPKIGAVTLQERQAP
jgi:hypothetical protein